MNKLDEERAAHLHENSIIIDGLEYTPDVGDAEYYYNLVKAGGITASNVTVVPDTPQTPLEAIKRLKPWYDLFEKHSDKFMLVTTGSDIEKAKREGKLGIIMGTQNPDILGDDLSLLPVWKRLGLRIIQLSYYGQNLLGEGGYERTNSGLSNFGIEVVKEMNRLGLVVDVSHCGDQVVMDAIRYSKDPILVTHANPRGLVDHFRNKTDEQIKALADKGGVIGLITGYALSEVRKGVPPTLDDFVDMIDYVVKLVGADHVGYGFDCSPFLSKEEFEDWMRCYPGIVGPPPFTDRAWAERSPFVNAEGGNDLSRVPEITRGLVAHSYSDQDIQKILGLNFLRVFKQVWGE